MGKQITYPLSFTYYYGMGVQAFLLPEPIITNDDIFTDINKAKYVHFTYRITLNGTLMNENGIYGQQFKFESGHLVIKSATGEDTT